MFRNIVAFTFSTSAKMQAPLSMGLFVYAFNVQGRDGHVHLQCLGKGKALLLLILSPTNDEPLTKYNNQTGSEMRGLFIHASDVQEHDGHVHLQCLGKGKAPLLLILSSTNANH